MIRALVIDDEADARFLLKNLLREYLSHVVEVVGEADDVPTGVLAVRNLRPDLVFLDIQMHQGTGFELLAQLEEINFEVIFVTAYDNYAVKAFQFSAFGYLMKPIKTRELKQVVGRLQDRFQELKGNVQQRMRVLVEHQQDDFRIRKLVVTHFHGFEVLALDEIIRLEGDRNYTHFYLVEGKKITASKSLGEYEDLLNDHGFFRIHRSFMVNLSHVKGYRKGDGGMVTMLDGSELQVSRHRKAGFIKRFL